MGAYMPSATAYCCWSPKRYEPARVGTGSTGVDPVTVGNDCTNVVPVALVVWACRVNSLV